MKDFQRMMEALSRDSHSGKTLPTAELAQAAQSARPLNQEELAVLCRAIEDCSEQIYEYYRALVDVFRAEAKTTVPDAQTIRLAVKLGMLDDEVWLPVAMEQEG